MTTYRLIASTETDPQAPITAALMKASDLNSRAIAEGDLTAPVNAACWHPYDMVFANDGAIGRFYNGTVAASVAVPTMVAGWDYLFRGIGISHNSGADQSLNINGTAITSTIAASVTVNFGFELIAPALTGWPKIITNPVRNLSSGGGNAVFVVTGIFTENATALTTFNFTWSAGSFDAGQLFMYRRRNYMP